MPVGPQKRLAIGKRRQRVAELTLQGKTQQVIADDLGVAQSTVSMDIKAAEKHFQEAMVRDLEQIRAVELAKLDRTEHEAWKAWERSQQPREETRVIQHGSERRAEKRVTQQHGDRHYLDFMLRCSTRRQALLGLDTPSQSDQTPANGGEPLLRLTMSQLLNLYQEDPEMIENDPTEQRLRAEREGSGSQDITESDSHDRPPPE